MNEVRTQGNFMVYGPQGERRAAFALESDRRLFEATEDLLEVLEDVYHDIALDDVNIGGSDALCDKAWRAICKAIRGEE